MDRVLCVILCVVAMVFAVNVLSYCNEVMAEPVAKETTTPITEPTVAETTKESTEVAIDPTEETTVATEPPTVPETVPPYTDDELEMLALVIYQEAGSDACLDDTRMMVGTVVMNRVADSRFPDTIYGVITQKAQYGRLHWTGVVWPERASHHSEAHAVARAYECAERILLGERTLPSDVIWQAEFIQGTEVVAYQDGMYFCR